MGGIGGRYVNIEIDDIIIKEAPDELRVKDLKRIVEYVKEQAEKRRMNIPEYETGRIIEHVSRFVLNPFKGYYYIFYSSLNIRDRYELWIFRDEMPLVRWLRWKILRRKEN